MGLVRREKKKVASNDTYSRRGRRGLVGVRKESELRRGLTCWRRRWKRQVGAVRGAHLLDADEGRGQGIRDTGDGRNPNQPSESGCGKQARGNYLLHCRKKTRGTARKEWSTGMTTYDEGKKLALPRSHEDFTIMSAVWVAGVALFYSMGNYEQRVMTD